MYPVKLKIRTNKAAHKRTHMLWLHGYSPIIYNYIVIIFELLNKSC